MDVYQRRLVDDKADLDTKLGKLKAFIISPYFPELDMEMRRLLKIQAGAMEQYSCVLDRRIELAEKENNTRK